MNHDSTASCFCVSQYTELFYYMLIMDRIGPETLLSYRIDYSNYLIVDARRGAAQ